VFFVVIGERSPEGNGQLQYAELACQSRSSFENLYFTMNGSNVQQRNVSDVSHNDNVHCRAQVGIPGATSLP